MLTNYKNSTFLNNGIEILWFNTAGFQLILSDGTTILVDPWLDCADIYPYPLNNIERVDYILLSHIHFDHAQDIDKILAKFPEAKLFVGDLSLDALCQWQHINLSQVYRVHSGERYIFDKVTFDIYAGRHTENAKGCYREDNVTSEMKNLSNWYGSLELQNYLITAADGTKVMIWGGMTTPDQKNRLRDLKPDIACMHVSPKQDFLQFADLIKSMGAQVVIPHHYDLVQPLFENNPELMELMLSDEAKEKFCENGKFSGTRFINAFKTVIEEQVPGASLIELEHHTWYRFGLAVSKQH